MLIHEIVLIFATLVASRPSRPNTYGHSRTAMDTGTLGKIEGPSPQANPTQYIS